MAATVSVKEVTGDPATPYTVTNVRHCTADLYNPVATYPLVKPAAGNNWSYWKTVYLNADVAPSTSINNVKWYTDGTISWTGCTLYAMTTDTYVPATGTPGTTGDEADGSDSPDCNDTAASTYTSGSPLSVAGSIAATTGKISDYVVTQIKLSTSAEPGALGAETITWRYDEV